MWDIQSIVINSEELQNVWPYTRLVFLSEANSIVQHLMKDTFMKNECIVGLDNAKNWCLKHLLFHNNVSNENVERSPEYSDRKLRHIYPPSCELWGKCQNSICGNIQSTTFSCSISCSTPKWMNTYKGNNYDQTCRIISVCWLKLKFNCCNHYITDVLVRQKRSHFFLIYFKAFQSLS